jgi:hypothetical protein
VTAVTTVHLNYRDVVLVRRVCRIRCL